MAKLAKNIILFLPRLFYRVCFAVGWVLVAMVQGWHAIFLGTTGEIAGKTPAPTTGWRHTKRRLGNKLKNLRTLRVGFTLLTFSILVVVVVGSFQAAVLIASGQRIKGQVLGAADQGLGHLGEAQTALQNQDANGANEQLALALQSFDQSRMELNSNNVILQGLLNLVPQKQDAERLLRATALLTQAGQEWAQFYQLSQTVKITPQGITATVESPLSSAELLPQMNRHLQTGKAKTDQAVELLSAVDPNIIPADKREAFIQAQGSLTAIRTAVVTVSEVFDIISTLAGGEKNVLLLFENNNELRATGGFLGTYGAMKLKDGQINALHISSIYDLDGQLKENFAPPYPMFQVTPQWHLRDTNWFTDFPQSAGVIARYYEKEGGETPDLTIALTPQVVVDLLRITGPVALPRYNTTFTPENFVELSQVESSINYDRTLNQPKQILADFFPAFLQQLGSLSGPQLMPVMSALQKNLQTKHILIYSREPELQARLEKFNWTGSVRPTDRDYVLISSSNLGGTKTDAYISQSASLQSTIGADGHIINTLSIERSSPLSDQDALRNLSFIRVYVPEGSRLVSAQGFSHIEAPRLELPDQKPDPDAVAWEKASVTDTVSGTLIGKESGKTIFGNWLELRGGETRTITLTYELPFTVRNDVDHYSLLWQKQPGTLNQTYAYSLNFEDYSIAWKTFQPTKLDSHALTIADPLDKDMFFGLILRK
jgi:uncharacterized protein DUF4012